MIDPSSDRLAADMDAHQNSVVDDVCRKIDAVVKLHKQARIKIESGRLHTPANEQVAGRGAA